MDSITGQWSLAANRANDPHKPPILKVGAVFATEFAVVVSDFGEGKGSSSFVRARLNSPARGGEAISILNSGQPDTSEMLAPRGNFVDNS